MIATQTRPTDAGARSSDGGKLEVPDEVKRVVVILIKPTSYDDQGFPYRFLRGVLPSNTLAAMNSLTREALESALPEEIEREIHICEDGIKSHAKRLGELYARFPEPGTKLIVGLVAVQSAQFPRACDLMEQWQSRGATCVIGGFHVSGAISALYDGIVDPHRDPIPCPHEMPADIQAIMDKGVIVFHGEAEEVWRETLSDIVAGAPKPLYRGGQPGLGAAPLPEYPPGYFEKSFATKIATFDSGRGCPYACSFCTIINVQGRKSRFRTPEALIATVEDICRREGRASFFFTDDNFARNPMWRKILTGLIDLRREGLKINFMIESDLACGAMKDFIPMLAEAGCSQMFMGVESMNPESLKDGNKWQNKLEQFEELWAKCHDHDIMVHAGYIVGFPHDTPDSVAEDVERLFQLGVDQASFFILTPLPGSEDHVRAVTDGIRIDPDLNKCDSFHPIVDHPLMSHDEWFATYQKAWRRFFRVSNMIVALKRCRTRDARRNLLRNFFWYRWSFATERTHPMIAGLYRFRDYKERRPSASPLSYPRYLLQEGWRHMRYMGRFLAEFYRFQHVVFETEYAPIIAEKREEVTGKLRGAGDWARRTFGRAMTRQWLNRFWIEYGRKRWNLLVNPWTYRWHVYMIPYALTEIVYTLRFALRLRGMIKGMTLSS